jgi:hypothetical protein
MRHSTLIASIVPALVAGTLACPATSAAIGPPPMTVSVNSASGSTRSYFRVSARPGQIVPAGALKLQNPTDSAVTVLLDPVGGLTASTLGSAYKQRGSKPTGAASWVSLGLRRVSLAPHGKARVPVTVNMGSGTRPGDYLAGVSVQSAADSGDVQLQGNVAVSSVQRYAIGVEIRVPGPRHPHLRLTGVDLSREPSATTFSILGRNDGNAILQNVRGSATISDGSEVVARRNLGPGTFVTGTSIAYPLLFPKLQPREGASYRVRAYLRYRGGTARIDKVVSFGAVDAMRQQAYGGPNVDRRGGGVKLLLFWLITGLFAACLAALELRRLRSGEAALRRALPRQIADARAGGRPLSVVLVSAAGAGPGLALRRSVRACTRQADRLYRFGESTLVVVSPDRAAQAGEALATEIRHQVDGKARGLTVIPVTGAEVSSAAEILEAAAIAFGVLAVAMSGCVIIKSNSSAQLNTIGAVQITTRFCASDVSNPANNTGYSPQDTTCQKNISGGNANAGGNSGSDAGNNTSLQLQVAYRIPSTVTAPATIVTTEPSGGSAITLTKNTAYGTALQSLSPAGSGKQWVGYLSSVQTYTTAAGQYFTVAPTFSLPPAGDGSPFQGPFNYRVAVGYRQVDEATPGNTSARTVTCGSDAFALYNDGIDGADGDTNPDMTGICIDDPSSATLASDLSQSTRDLGIVAGSAQSVHAATTATVPFTVEYAGAAGAGPFTMSATTTIPSTTATPSQASYTPSADSNQAMTVSVPVPAGTTAGTYNVTLKADLGNGQIRQQTNTVTVGTCFCFETSPALPTTMGTVTLNGQAQTKTAQMNNFAVNNTNGTSGWNVTVVGDSSAGKSAVFKEYCPGPSACGSVAAGTYATGGKTLAANSLTLNTTGASWTGGGGATPTFSCGSGCSVDRSTAIKIASAASGGGTGLWSTSGFGTSSLSLAAPTTMRALSSGEQYHLDAVWSLNSGP